MPRKLIAAHCSLIVFLLLSCQPSPAPPPTITFYALSPDPLALIEYSPEFKPIKETPLSFPPNCGLNNVFPTPVGGFLAIELYCPNGQTVLFLDADSGEFNQPVSDSDSHFLAWAPDGEAAYLKVDSLGDPRVVRLGTNGRQDFIPITELTYDLSANPGNQDFTFTFSRGLGYGSEIWLARQDGRIAQQLYADRYNYISFARWSPDGERIAFIKIPDTQTPFTVGELWVMDSDGSNAHKLADADAGHGYAANWSPDGRRIAFVVRENPEDERADQSSDALISNVYVANVESGALYQITKFAEGRVETPFWSPDGNTLAFSAVVDGRMNVYLADILRAGAGSSVSVEMTPIETESACCPAWMRK